MKTSEKKKDVKKVSFLPFTKGEIVSGARPKAAHHCTEFVIDDLGDYTYLVNGLDATETQVDISKLATIAVTSDDTDIVTCSVTAPTTFVLGMGGKGEGSAELTIVVSWNDKTPGTTFTLPVDVKEPPPPPEIKKTVPLNLTIQPGEPKEKAAEKEEHETHAKGHAHAHAKHKDE